MNGRQKLCDVVYASVGDKDLLLDLYLPSHAAGPVPVILAVHGGAWRKGSKENPHALRMVERGYAVASITYRLSLEAIFPAQIHDCKAAVRWLRAHAGQYDLDPGRIGAWGGSAGGHLVALLGTSAGVEALEGTLGHSDQSSEVQAVCDFYGPSDFLRMNDLPGTMDHESADSPESQLIGAPIREQPDRVARANPITYIDGTEPPFLIIHGQQDKTVLINQSELLHAALQSAGVSSTFHPVPGAGHGFRGIPPAEKAKIDRWVDAFFDRHLKAARP